MADRDDINAEAARAAMKNMVGNPLLFCIGIFGDAYLRLAKFCIRMEANVDETNSFGVTALHCASITGHVGPVQFLVECGANVDARTIDEVTKATTVSGGLTTLHYASIYGHGEIVQLLIDSGSNLDAISSDGYTALHCACSNGHGEIVQLLFDSGSNLEARCRDGYTALHFAIIMCHPTVVRYLLQKGANANAMNCGGMTPLHLAVAYGKLNTMSLLHEFDETIALGTLRYGDDDDTMTALQLAMSNGRSDIVKDLVKKFVRP
jgi:ankyrin repeat protein